MAKKQSIFTRLLLYIIGLLIIALGINISKLSGLGISPVSSIPGVLNAIIPSFSLGSMVIIVYIVLIIAQIIVLRKSFKLVNILGVPVAIIFGWMVDFVGTADFKLTIGGIDIGIERTFTGLMKLLNVPKPESYPFKLGYLIVSIIVIGIGVYIYLKPKLVPMPAEGLAQAISQKSKMKFGNCKTIVDMSMILIAALLQIVFLGGFASFTTNPVVREGTILSAFCVGQTVKLLNKIFKKK